MGLKVAKKEGSNRYLFFCRVDGKLKQGRHALGGGRPGRQLAHEGYSVLSALRRVHTLAVLPNLHRLEGYVWVC